MVSKKTTLFFVALRYYHQTTFLRIKLAVLSLRGTKQSHNESTKREHQM
jgi:hypothetical protein